jgi:5'-methylthioinosine phosphorylase
MTPMQIDLAVIGGTGLYAFPGLQAIERVPVATPFGEPSGVVMVGKLADKRVAFLARHGEGHTIVPHRVNFRANVYALKHLGATRVIGVNAVGGIRDDMGPRTIVVPHQLIDYTHGRYTSFCDIEGAKVEHVDFTEPYTPSLRAALIAAAAAKGVAVVAEGVHGITQGPRLETAAEVERMRRDGCDLVGMTGMPEAVLARELGLEYACVAMVANWAAGCGGAQTITMAEVFDHLEATTARIPPIISALLGH